MQEYTCFGTCQQKTKLHILLILSMLILLLFVTSCGDTEKFSEEKNTPNQATPELAVKSLLKAFSEKDISAVKQLTLPKDSSNQIVIKGFQKAIEEGVSMEFADIEIKVKEDSPNLARVQVSFHQIIRIDDQIISNERSGALYTLVKQDDKWYFVGLGQFPPPEWIER